MSRSFSNVDDVIDLTADNDSPPTTTLRQSEPPPCVAAVTTQRRQTFARPWWHRLPHLVPAAAIEFDAQEGRGINPRTGETVYVDYLNQFQTDTASMSAVKRPKLQNEKRRREIPAETKGRPTEVTLTGEWTTDASGKEVFRTSDGKNYKGMKAYKMHAMILTRQSQNLKVEKRTS